MPTLQRFAEDFQRRTMAEVTISEMGERTVLQSTLSSYLFRAIKEVVNNAVKHGNAKEIIVADPLGCGADAHGESTMTGRGLTR